MSQTQGKNPKDTNATTSAEDEKTRTLSKLELSQMLERAEDALNASQLEDLTPKNISVFFESSDISDAGDSLETPSVEEEAFLQKEHVASAGDGEVANGFPKLELEERAEEVTRPGIRLAAYTKQVHKIQALLPLLKSPKGFLLLGVLIGMLAGGMLFMLGHGLFSSPACG